MPRSGLVQQCSPPNTYPPSRQMLGRFAPGIRRASGPVSVTADVRQDNMPLDQWCARNLGFLAVIGGIFIGLLLGPLLLLLFIIGPMYAFQGFQFMPWYQMLSSLVTICLSAFLLAACRT